MGMRVLAFTVSACVAMCSARVLAAPPWVDRHLTLPSGVWAFDLGLAMGSGLLLPTGEYAAHGLPPSVQGALGINAEVAVAVTSYLELGVRTGIRVWEIGDVAQRPINPDKYGRLFDRQSFDEGARAVANPELRARGALLRGRVIELALEGRVVLPVLDQPTCGGCYPPGVEGRNAGVLFGVPLAFHLGNRVRVDTGVYLPVIFGDGGTILGPQAPDTYVAISLPLDVWIQVTRRFWLGPMTGLLIEQPGNSHPRPQIAGSPAGPHLSFGFGFGYEITRYLDFRAMFLFPTVNNETRIFGIGAGAEIRIE